MFIYLIEIYTKIYPANLKGDVAILSLLGVAVISHLANPHLKKKEISAVERLFRQSCFSIANLHRHINATPVFIKEKHAFLSLL